jgi:hypothetical protein
MLYRVFCIIPDGNPAFSVRIDDTETVDDLKGAFKDRTKPKLDAFAAYTLTLYYIDVDLSSEEQYIERVNHPGLEELEAGDTLTEVFEPFSRRIHILVQPPGVSQLTQECGSVAETM